MQRLYMLKTSSAASKSGNNVSIGVYLLKASILKGITLMFFEKIETLVNKKSVSLHFCHTSYIRFTDLISLVEIPVVWSSKSNLGSRQKQRRIILSFVLTRGLGLKLNIAVLLDLKLIHYFKINIQQLA